MASNRIKTGRRVASLAIITALLLAFQNCGQPGQLAPLSPIESISSDLPPGSTDGNNPANPVFKNYSKDVNILAAASKLDVLVVVDNSGSMSFEQRNMGDRFSTMVQQLAGLDWRVGVTTTDVNFDDPAEVAANRNAITGRHDGQLLAMGDNRHWVSSEDAMNTAQQIFARTVQRDERGSGREQGIKATYKFLEHALTANTVNSRFLRPDAALSVVVVTDADETVHYDFVTDRNRPEKLLEMYNARFVGKPFSFHSIIVRNNDVNCLRFPNSENEGYGLSYQALSTSTGGVIGSVCEMDYASQLRLIGMASAQLVKNVSLDCSPVDADKNGMLDVVVRATDPNVVIPNYVVNANQLMFAQDLPVGSYKVEYRCLDVQAQPAQIAPVQ